MHRTDTIDFNLIVSGEVWLELDDGVEVQLKAGDCVVQNGARHRWRNPSSEPCIMAVAQIGAARRPSKDRTSDVSPSSATHVSAAASRFWGCEGLGQVPT